jgi:Arc/MetJ-type ribon-helix-helix transcriptional regulator
MARYAKRKDNPYIGLSIPSALANSAKDLMRREGYVSLSDLVRDLLREWVRKVVAYRIEEETK